MNDLFYGYVELESTLKAPLLTDVAGVPTDATGNPTYRVYGPDSSGVMNNGSGSVTAHRDTKAITDASNTSPIVITSVGHGLQTGQKVTVSGVLGNTAANGSFIIIVTGANTFSLTGSTGNGSYTAATGTWWVTGLYTVDISIAAADGYASGETYEILFTAVVSGTTVSSLLVFGVT